MRYRNFKALLREFLDGYPEYAVSDNNPNPVPIYPGPDDPRIPTWYVLLTPYGGTGPNTEELFDGAGWQVKVVSEQGDYDSGEDLALLIDQYLRFLPSGTYHDEYVTSFQRSGGRPAALSVDDGDRTHFVCSYIIDVQSAAG